MCNCKYSEIIRRYANTILINAQSHNSSRGAPRGQSEGDYHQEFYLVSNLWVFLCVYYNGYKCVLYVFTLVPQYSEHYAVKTSPSTYINVVH